MEKAKEVARLAKLRRQQDRAVQCLVIVDSSSDDELNDPPRVDDGYSYAGDQKGKGPAQKW